MNNFNWKHYIFIAIAFSVVPIKTYTSIYLKDAGNESWIPLIGASIILCLYVAYSMRIFNKNNCYSVSEIYKKALGNFLGQVMLMYLFISIFIMLIETASVITSIIHTNLLIETPMWFSLLFIVITGILVGSKGTKSVILTTMICVCVIMFFGINLSILAYKYKDYTRLLPVFQKEYKDYLLSLVKFVGGYSYYVVAFLYLIKIENKEKINKGVIISLIFIIQLVIVSVTGQIATFQINRILKMTYPTLFQTQLIEENNLIGVGELFVILQIILGWSVRYIVTFKALLILLKEMKMDIKYANYGISVLAYISAYFVSNNLFQFIKTLNTYNYISVANMVIIPLIIFTIFHFRNRKKRKNIEAENSSRKRAV